MYITHDNLSKVESLLKEGATVTDDAITYYVIHKVDYENNISCINTIINVFNERKEEVLGCASMISLCFDRALGGAYNKAYYLSIISVWTEIKYFSMKLGYIHIKLQDTGF
jgi:hypothetical protein